VYSCREEGGGEGGNGVEYEITKSPKGGGEGEGGPPTALPIEYVINAHIRRQNPTSAVD